MNTKLLAGFIVAACCAAVGSSVQAENNVGLDARQDAIVPIAAFAASGELKKLKQALNDGLDAGLSINKIKEILIQLYAYAGFPRSLNAIGTFMEVVEEREKKDIRDAIGKDAGSFPADKSLMELGTQIQTTLVGEPVAGPIFTFAPPIDRFLKEHLFGDIFGRDNLDYKSREIATLSALANMEGVASQMASHFKVSLNHIRRDHPSVGHSASRSAIAELSKGHRIAAMWPGETATIHRLQQRYRIFQRDQNAGLLWADCLRVSDDLRLHPESVYPEICEQPELHAGTGLLCRFGGDGRRHHRQGGPRMINDRNSLQGVVTTVGGGIAGLVLLLTGQVGIWAVTAGGFLFGWAYAGVSVETPMLVRAVFGSKDYAKIYSNVSIALAAGGAITAGGWGLLADLTTFRFILSLGIAFLTLAGSIGAVALKVRKVETGA